jgi:hypothetical protein
MKSTLTLLDRLRCPAWTFDDGMKVLNEAKAIADMAEAANEIGRLTAELRRLVPGYMD